MPISMLHADYTKMRNTSTAEANHIARAPWLRRTLLGPGYKFFLGY